MEGKSGFDVAQYLRTQCRMPFMFLSAFSDEETVAQVEALGAVAYLVKPLDIRQIVPAVEAAFAHLEAGRSEARAGHAPPHRGAASNDPLPTVVAMAAGVLMHRHSLTRDEALERLGRLAAADGVGLAEQAELLLAAVERLAGRSAPTLPSVAAPRGPNGPLRGPWGAAGLGAARRPAGFVSAGQGEVEARAAIRLALGADRPAVAQDDAAHRRQADAGAREFAGAVQALEGAEQAIGEAHVEAGAVVAHREGRRLARMAQEGDPRRRGVAGVLPGVAEQVLEHHAQQRRVAGGGQPGLDLDLDLALGREAPQVLDHVAGQQREVDRRLRQRLRRQPREREQRVDHVVHPRRRAEHAVEVVDADACRARRRSPP